MSKHRQQWPVATPRLSRRDPRSAGRVGLPLLLGVCLLSFVGRPAVAEPVRGPLFGSAPSRSTLGTLPVFSPLRGGVRAAPRWPTVGRAAAPRPGAARPGGAQPRVTAQAVCKKHKHCPDESICVQGRCVAQRCKSDLECPAESFCLAKKKICVRIKRPINIAYLYYRSANRRTTAVLGLYHHKRGVRGYRVMAPLYWNFWNERKDTRVLFPLYWSVRNKKKRTLHAFFLNFHYYKSPRQTEFNIWPILFGTSYGKRGGAFTLIPLFHYGREGKRWSVASALPLPWFAYSRPGKVAWGVLPFTAGVRTRDKSFVWAAPLNFYWRKKSAKHYLFLPLYYGQSDRQLDTRTSVLFPFFYYSRDPQKTKFVSLLATYSRNRSAGWRYFLWTAPPMFFSRDRERDINIVFPLYFGYRNKLRRSSLHMVTPFVWHYRDHRQRNTAVLPLFFYFGDKRTNSYAALLFPLFYRHRTQEGERLTVLGPWYLRQRRSGWASGLFPIAFFGSDRKSAHAVIFPVFWHLKNKQERSSFTLAGPLFVTRGPKSWSFGLLPLVFAGSSPRANHQVIFPLFWRFHDRVKQKRWTVLGPAFWWRHRGSHGHGLFPFYWFRRQYLRTGHVVSSLFVFPLLYHLNTPRRRVLFTPLGGLFVNRVKRSKTLWALTGFGHQSPTSSSVGVLPFFVWNRNRVKRTKTLWVFPLNVYQKGPKSSSLVVFPLLWNFKSPGYHSLLVAPLYWHLRQKKGWNADVVFPLFWYFRKGHAKTVIAGPVYWNRTTQNTRRFGVAPIFHVGWDKQSTYAHFFPIFWHYRNHKTKGGFTVAGPYYSAVRRDGHHSGVLPLVYWGRKRHKRYAVGFPLVWHFSNAKKQSSTTFVGPLFWHRRGKVWGGGLAPLLWIQAGPKRAQFSLLPLLHVDKRAGRYDVWTPLFGLGADPALGKRYGYAGPVYWESSPKRNAQVVFPLFWRFAHPQTKRSKTLLLPLYYGSKTRESQFHVVFPLVWYAQSVTSRTLFLLPFFYDKLDRDEKRATAVVPLFYRRRVYHKKESTWIIPPAALYIRTQPKETDVVLFPLVWHFAEATKSTTVVVPLYWDFKRPGKRTTIFFPLFWRFERGNTVKMVILNSYYKYNRSEKTYQFLFLPLFEVARKRPGDFKFAILGGLVGYERIGRNRSLQLFFFRINLKPTAAPSGPRTRAPAQSTFYPI